MAAAYASHVLFTNWYKKTIEDQQMILVTRMADELDNKIEFAQEALIGEAKLFTPDTIENPLEAEHVLSKQIVLDSIFDSGLFLFSTTGKIIAETSYKPSRTGFDLSYREYIKNTIRTGKPYISHPYISSTSHMSVIMFTAPIFAQDGKMIAIFGGSLNLQKADFLGKLARAKIGKTGYFFLFNRHRTMIMHPNPGRISKTTLHRALTGASTLPLPASKTPEKP